MLNWLRGDKRDKAGFYKGKHYTEWLDEVRRLERAGNDAQAEGLLLALVDATEAENRAEKAGVAPWYYERLAILYRKRKDGGAEVAILERFLRQKPIPPGELAGKLKARLAKVKAS